MTTDWSLNTSSVHENASSECSKNMLCTEIVLNVKTKTKQKQFLHTTCTKFVIQ